MSDELLITVAEFARVFKRNLRACQRRAKSGRWKEAQFIGGRWYVLVPARALKAAKATAA